MAASAFASAPSVHAAEEPVYDAFAKMLAPFSSSIFGGGNGRPGALVAECLVSAGSGPLADAQGVRFRIAIQAPDHIRVDVIRNNTRLTACRNGKELWAVPKAPMSVLAQAAGLDLAPPSPNAAPTPLIPLAFDAQTLAFLPIVFDVKDLGKEGTPPRRIVEFSLLPELIKQIGGGEFSARTWIGEDYKPARLLFTVPGSSLDIIVEKLEFADKLPDGAWLPNEGTVPLRLSASSLNALFEKMLGGKIPKIP